MCVIFALCYLIFVLSFSFRLTNKCARTFLIVIAIKATAFYSNCFFLKSNLNSKIAYTFLLHFLCIFFHLARVKLIRDAFTDSYAIKLKFLFYFLFFHCWFSPFLSLSLLLIRQAFATTKTVTLNLSQSLSLSLPVASAVIVVVAVTSLKIVIQSIWQLIFIF